LMPCRKKYMFMRDTVHRVEHIGKARLLACVHACVHWNLVQKQI
jgi:hypothetical protein